MDGPRRTGATGNPPRPTPIHLRRLLLVSGRPPGPIRNAAAIRIGVTGWTDSLCGKEKLFSAGDASSVVEYSEARMFHQREVTATHEREAKESIENPLRDRDA